MTRDPLGEAGGINLYGFVGNDAINGIDPLGLARKKSDGWWDDCNDEEMARCIAQCGSRGVKSCKQWVRITDRIIPDGEHTIDIRRPYNSLSCKCNDDDDCLPEEAPTIEPNSTQNLMKWLPLLIPILTPWPDPI
jgi:hypothetical protein